VHIQRLTQLVSTRRRIVTERVALYFGRLDVPGHYLYESEWRKTVYTWRDLTSFPWGIDLLDTGLLRNRKVPDRPDGRVHWTCGGHQHLWHAFFWWDRSGDERSNSNSGFYVRGFCIDEVRGAFEYACEQWPDVVERQRFQLVLVEVAR
jgi:hypothetical protein